MSKPATQYDGILLAHGGGGRLTHDLITKRFLPHLGNELLEALGDSALLSVGGSRLCFTTDSYVVKPVFFPGGNIGSLAVHGTVNDLSVSGGRPLFLSAGFILEEGFPLADLDLIAASMGQAAREAGVRIAAGDTKVVAKGSADGVFINTAGIGLVDYPGEISPRMIAPGDAVIVNGTMGDHGAAILGAREGLEFASGLRSDCASLNGIIREVLHACPDVHFMRDATRGGLAAVLSEAAAAAGARIEIEERSIPVKDEVRGLCEILGLDPLYIANEGKFVLFCPARDAAKVLAIMKANPLGQDAACIGEVTSLAGRRVVLRTAIGGSREIDLPVGELIPRIC